MCVRLLKLNWICRDGLTREETEELVIEAVSLAMARDGSSGGVVRLVTISKDGAEKRLVLPKDQPVMWDENFGGERPVGMVV
jgi:20S proteasome subunit beta 1